MWALGAADTGTAAEDTAVAELRATLQTKKEIEADLSTWSYYAQQGGDIASVNTPEQAAEIVRAGLVKYAQDEGWAVTGDVQRDVDNLARGFGEEALRSQGVSMSLRFKSLEGAAVNMCCAGVTYTTGVNPQLARLSVESFADGRLSSEEMCSTCALAGSLAGAAVGQMFGIPAPIGAWVGGLIGNEIGGVVADIFGLGSDAEDEVEKQRQEQRAALAQMRAEANQLCSEARVEYWRAFDRTLQEVEKQWQRLECVVGRRFDVRWFGAAGGAAHAFGFNRNTTRAVLCGGTYCCPHVFGCPYPPSSSQGADQLERVAAAFAARSFAWPRCEQRQPCDLLQYREISGESDAVRASRITQYQWYLIRNAQGMEQPDYWGPAYQGYVNAYLSRPGGPPSRFRNLDSMTTAIVDDLVMTAGAVKAEMEVKAERARLRVEGLAEKQKAARAALLAYQSRANLLNYGMLALGAGALGYAVWQKRR